MNNRKDIKTTCTKKECVNVLPTPPAKVVADIVGVSTDYVKKINAGSREAKTHKGELVKQCNELLIEGQKILLIAVSEVIEKAKQPQTDTPNPII